METSTPPTNNPIAAPLRTARFTSHMITLAVLTVLGGLSLWLRADQGLTIAIITAIAGYGATYQVAGAAHDSSVRRALIEASAPTEEVVEVPRP